MQLYKYETHAHTSEVSRCAVISGVEIVRVYKDLGFSGICITDHFLNGNTTVSLEPSWDEQIAMFCRGYEKAHAEGKRIGIDVFFGWEYTYRGTDLLTYGLDKKWLLEHPEIMDLSMNDYCDLVHLHGGFIVHAHPFREASYIDMIRLLPRKVDAVETVNACRTDFENILADQYADNYGLLKVYGSDNHVGMLDRICGMQSDRRLKSIEEMVSALANDEMEPFELCF